MLPTLFWEAVAAIVGISKIPHAVMFCSILPNQKMSGSWKHWTRHMLCSSWWTRKVHLSQLGADYLNDVRNHQMDFQSSFQQRVVAGAHYHFAACLSCTSRTNSRAAFFPSVFFFWNMLVYHLSGVLPSCVNVIVECGPFFPDPAVEFFHHCCPFNKSYSSMAALFTIQGTLAKVVLKPLAKSGTKWTLTMVGEPFVPFPA